jgi:hypothetical protein
MAFQAASLPLDEADQGDVGIYIANAQYFECNNTISQVQSDDDEILSADYLLSDLVARMLAGALGWSDNVLTLGDTAEWSSYANISSIGFYKEPTTANMANLVSQFTMGLVSFL